MATPLRPSPLSFNSSTRESPFKRQNSTASPATTVRGSTPNVSPTKHHSSSSSLSPEKTSPFVRRPSQISPTSERPSSPLARAGSSLSFDDGSERGASRINDPPSRQATPALIEDERSLSPAPLNPRNRPSPFDGPASESPSSKTITDISATPNIKPPVFHGKNTPAAPTITPATTFQNTGAAGYNQIPPALLRSMRESFEVLDASNSGFITPAGVTAMLDQLGLPSDSFPNDNKPTYTQLNLARYLDTLSAPLIQLSHPDELAAAFSAFDVDDSGQIDVAELKRAMMTTAPEPGEEDYRLSEKEVDGILAEFAGRRAFGGKGMTAAKGKSEVFRWREFMAGISGGAEGEGVVA